MTKEEIPPESIVPAFGIMKAIWGRPCYGEDDALFSIQIQFADGFLQVFRMVRNSQGYRPIVIVSSDPLDSRVHKCVTTYSFVFNMTHFYYEHRWNPREKEK